MKFLDNNNLPFRIADRLKHDQQITVSSPSCTTWWCRHPGTTLIAGFLLCDACANKTVNLWNEMRASITEGLE